MKKRDKTKEELLKEIEKLKFKIAKLEEPLENIIHDTFVPRLGRFNDTLIHNLIQAMPDLIWLKDPNGVYLVCNSRFEDFFGASIKDIVGKTDYDFVDNQLADFFRAKDLVAIEAGKPSVNEEELVFASDGHREILETVKTPIFDTEKKLIGVLGVARDITDRKRIEIDLQKSKRKYQDVFEKSKDANLIIHNNKFIDCNASAVEMLSFERKEDIIGKFPIDLSPEFQEEGVRSDGKALEMIGVALTNGSHRFEWLHQKPNGEIFPVEVSLTSITNEKNNQVLYTTWRDITESKKSKLELQKSEQRFRRLFNGLGDAVYVTEIGGPDRGRILEANTAAIEQTGYSKKELLQMNIIDDLFISGSENISTKDWDTLLSEGKKVTTTEKKRKKDGTEFWTDIIVTTIEFNGKQASLSINHDITDRKEIEDALIVSEEHFRKLFDNTSIGFFRTTPTGQIIFGNPALVKMLGYDSFSDLATRNLEKEEFFIDSSRLKFRHQVERDGYVKGMESVWTRKDGSEIFIMENTRSVLDENGNVEYYEGTAEDITNRKKAELLLKESEVKYRTLIDNMQDGVFLIRDAKILFANDAFATIVGREVDEVLHKEFIQFVAPEDRDLVLTNYSNQMQGLASPSEYEFRILHEDGNRVYVNMTIEVIEYNNIPGALATIKDISAGKKIQEQLILREKYYRTLFDLSPSGISVIDTQGVMLDVNDSFCSNLGYKANELLGKNIAKIVPVNKHNKKDNHIHEVLNGKTIREEVVNIAKDGSKKNIELHETKVILPNGRDGILSIANDITERKRVAKIQSVIYKISYAINLTENLDELIEIIRNELGSLIDTTNFFVALYEEDTDTIQLPYIADKRNTFKSFPAGKSYTAHVIKTMKSLLITSDEYNNLESERDLESVGAASKNWLGVPMIIKGKATGAIVVQSYDNENAYDHKDMEMLEFVSHAVSITIERKKSEQNLLKALERATESDRLKSSFLATMSHELRTPLNSVIGFSDIIDEDLPLEDILEFNKSINASGMHLLTIIEDILDITMIETGEIRIEKEYFDLITLLNVVEENSMQERLKADKEYIDFVFKIPSGSEKISLYNDQKRLTQILINLIKNAFKFTREGKVEFGYYLIEDTQTNELVFYVKDTGIGVPMEKQEFIFNVFRQVEDSHSRTYGGTGLGLSISRKLADLMNGKLWIESQVGEGSAFYLRLPLS